MHRFILVFVALVSLLAPSSGDGAAREQRTHVETTASGTFTVQELFEPGAAVSDETPGEAPLLRDGELLWHRNYPDAIYLSSELAGPSGVLFAGTYLNPPERAELHDIDGDGTPNWVFAGEQFVTAASRDGSVLAAVDYVSTTQTVTVYRWDPVANVPLWSFPISPASPGSKRSIAVSADGSTIAVLVTMQGGSPMARLYLFDPTSSTPIGQYEGPGGFGRNLSIGEDGRFTAFIGLATAYVVDRDTDTVRWSGSMGASNDPIAISTDGNNLAYGWTSLQMREWNGSSYIGLWSVPGGGQTLTVCEFSGDGSSFAVGWRSGGFNQNRVQLYEPSSNSPLWSYLYDLGSGEYNDLPSDIALTPDASYILVGSWGDIVNTNDEVHLFAGESSEPIFTLDTGGSVFDVDLVSDGACGVYLTACGKGVHANQQGRGGDLYSVHYSCPATTPGVDPATSSISIEGVPNPFRPNEALRFALERRSAVAVEVFDPAGRHIRRLFDGILGEGSHEVHWDGQTDQGGRARSGIYFFRIEGEGRTAVVRTVLLP